MEVIQKSIEVSRYLRVDYDECIFIENNDEDVIIQVNRGLSTTDGRVVVYKWDVGYVPFSQVTFITELNMVEFKGGILIPTKSRSASVYRKGLTLGALDFKIVDPRGETSSLRDIPPEGKVALCLPPEIGNPPAYSSRIMQQSFSTVLQRFVEGENQPMIIDKDTYITPGGGSNIKNIYLYRKRVATYNIRRQEIKMTTPHRSIEGIILKQLARRGIS